MSIGKEAIIIDADDFAAGMGTTAYSKDGGFSPESNSINLQLVPGVLYGTALQVDKSGTLAGDIIASCEDPILVGNYRYFTAIDSNQHAKFYKWDGSSLSLTASDAVGTYLDGTTDMVPYASDIFVSTQTSGANNVVKVSTNFTSVSADWWHTLTGNYLTDSCRHPLQVFNKTLYIGDKNKIHSFDGATGVTVLTLSSENTITALGFDPGSGLMLVAISNGANYSGNINTSSFIGYWDGINPTQFRKKVPVDEQVNAIYTHGSIVYVTYGNNLGYWNGSGITFLRKLKSVTLSGAVLPYKHHITHIGSTLFVADGTETLAYGPIKQGGSNVFWYVSKNDLGAGGNIRCLANIGSDASDSGMNKLGISAATNTFYTFSLTSTSSSNGSFYSRRYKFKKPIFLRAIEVFYKDSIADGTTPGSMTIVDENNVNYAFGAVNELANNSGNTLYALETPSADMKIKILQLRYTFSLNKGIEQIIARYDPAE